MSHMSIVNSMTYDQRRRDIMINLRNSCSYFAGIFVPTVSFFIFTYVDDEMQQFSILSQCCIGLGLIACVTFALVINEP